jgi:hypothetical protein
LAPTSAALAQIDQADRSHRAGRGTDGYFRVLAKEATLFIKDPIVVRQRSRRGGNHRRRANGAFVA